MNALSARRYSHRRITTLLVALLLALAGLGALGSSPAWAAAGGPVILGGDDLTDHGSYDGTTQVNEEGWLYIEKAIGNIKPKVTRDGADGSIAALGSADPSFDPTMDYGGDAGAAIASAAAKNSMPVSYYATEAEINGFFDALRAGTAKPSIIWIAGDGAGNDLGDHGGAPALVANATTIGDFVNSGGGLMSHGTEYGWLGGVLPGVTMACESTAGSGDLVLTPEGNAAFPGLTDADVNAGPWHGCFEGDIGDLKTLVRSTTVKDSAGNDARVVIGGAGVTLPGTISLTPASDTNPVGTSHTVTATVRNSDGSPRSGVTVSFSVTSGPGSGAAGNGVTNASGQATFTYTNNGTPGTDTIQAAFTENQVTFSATASKTWQGGQQTGGQGSAEGDGTTFCRTPGSARGSRCWTFDFDVTNVPERPSLRAAASSGPRGSAIVNPPGRGRFVAKHITMVDVQGDTADFTATGKWRNRNGYTLYATVVDGLPDEVHFEIRKNSSVKKKVDSAVKSGHVTVTSFVVAP